MAHNLVKYHKISLKSCTKRKAGVLIAEEGVSNMVHQQITHISVENIWFVFLTRINPNSTAHHWYKNFTCTFHLSEEHLSQLLNSNT